MCSSHVRGWAARGFGGSPRSLRACKIYVRIYIYIYIQRERYRYRYIYIYIFVFIYYIILCVYMDMYVLYNTYGYIIVC